MQSLNCKVRCWVADLGDNWDVILGEPWLLQYRAELSYDTESVLLHTEHDLVNLRCATAARSDSGTSITALAGPVPLLFAVDMAEVVEEDHARVFVLSVLNSGDPIMIAGGTPDAVPAGESPQLTALLKEYADVFKMDFGLPPERNTVHVIDLEPDAKPVYTRMCRLRGAPLLTRPLTA